MNIAVGLSSEEPENISSNDLISDIEPHDLKKANKNVSVSSDCVLICDIT